MSLSKLAEECKKCKYVDICEHKRMEAVGFLQGKKLTPVESMMNPFKNSVNITDGLNVTESTASQNPVIGVIDYGLNARSTLIEAIVKQFEQGLGGSK